MRKSNRAKSASYFSVFMAMLAVFGLVVAISTSVTFAQQSSTPIVDSTSEMPIGATSDRSTNMEEVPLEIQELFADGMSAEEFVQMTGYVPAALEGFVEGDALMIIELEGDPLAVTYAQQRDMGQRMSTASIESQANALESVQAGLQPQIEALGVEIISNYTTVYNGFQALVPLNQLNNIRELPGVIAVHPAPIHEPAVASGAALIGATDVWADFGYTGEDIVIAIIDTGIDYTHAAFDGSGDPDDYTANNPNIVELGSFPTQKVIAGYDFAGTLYNASCPPADVTAGICSLTPQPDLDPLDEGRHGTHVAATAAGIAVGNMGSGVAPDAKLVALKVFGRDGSTSLTIDALEWATNNYMVFGWPQVINMSLGSNFGTNNPNDPSFSGTQNASAAGIVVVASAGNAGNNSYITGSPGSADRAISVAASTTGYVTGPTINVSGTTYITQTNIVYTPASFDDNTGHYEETTEAPLAYVANLTGATNNQLCTTAGLAENALDGQIALIQRGGCAFSVKVDNAAALGAVGAIIYNNAPGVFGGVGTAVTIPAAFIQMPDGENLIPAEGEIIVVSAKDDVETVANPYTPADTIATFSSRGPRGFDSALKPEITAPGVAIFAANAGSGTGGVSLNGTSMAAPHVAGVAALMLQANPDWSPEAIKATMMNTAVPLADGTTIPRSGAGRIDAYRAVTTTVYAVGDADLVSLSWHVPMSRNDSWSSAKQVTLYNTGVMSQVFTTTVMAQTGTMTVGAMIAVEPVTVTVPAGGSAVVTVTLDLDMTQIPVTRGPGGVEEYFGFVGFTPPGGDATDTLVVPYYLQPRPYSELTVSGSGVITDVTNMATFDLTHNGPITSSLRAFPALIWNDTPNPAMAGPGDVRLFGMNYGGTHPTYGDMIQVGINSWDYWHVPQPFFAEFDLYIDANQDGVPDYVNFNYNLGWLQGAGNNNTWVVIQVDLSTGMLYLGSPFLINTDYNSSYMEWNLPAAWQDLGPANSSFDYQLRSFDTGVSINPPRSFDYARSPLGWTISNNPGPITPTATLSTWINDLTGYYYSQPQGVMIVDYNGDPRNNNGGQAYFEPITLEVDTSWLQVAHLAPFAMDSGTAVTVTLNGEPALTNFQYGDSTGYLALPTDEYYVEVWPAGSSSPAMTATVDLMVDTYYSAIATGDGVNQPLALLPLVDDNSAPVMTDTFKIRLGHLAPFAEGMATADIRLSDGTPVITGVNYLDVADYIELPAGTYNLNVTTPGGDTVLIDLTPATFAAGDIVTAFATGDGVNQSLGVFALPPNKPGSFLPVQANIRVSHLAPFASDTASDVLARLALDSGTAVTVTLNGDAILTDFMFADSTDYISVPAGVHEVAVLLPNGTPVITGTVTLAPGEDYTAVAIGGANGHAPALLALLDDNSPVPTGFGRVRLGHLAPFTTVITDTMTDIRLQDGTPVLTNVVYSTVADYIQLPVATYDLKVTTPGGETTLIEILPFRLNDGDVLDAFAIGDDDNQPLGVFAQTPDGPGRVLPTDYMNYLPIVFRP